MSQRLDYTKAQRRELAPYHDPQAREKQRKARLAFKRCISKGWRSPQFRKHGPVRVYTPEECKQVEDELRAAGRL